MSAFLDHYGEEDVHRERIWKRAILIVLTLVVVLVAAFVGLRNRKEKAVVSEFAAFLTAKDYPSAYRLWGCSESKPCPDYAYEKFLEDWGPKSPYADVSGYSIGRARSCGTGVIVTLDLGKNRFERFWVDGRDLVVGYSPWPICPRPTMVERVLDKLKDWLGYAS